MGHEPRVALLSHSNFGNAPGGVVEVVRQAVMELDALESGGHPVDFEYDGELNARAALSPDLMKLYPFCRLSGPRSEEHTSELQSLMRISYAVFCLKKKIPNKHITRYNN